MWASSPPHSSICAVEYIQVPKLNYLTETAYKYGMYTIYTHDASMKKSYVYLYNNIYNIHTYMYYIYTKLLCASEMFELARSIYLHKV